MNILDLTASLGVRVEMQSRQLDIESGQRSRLKIIFGSHWSIDKAKNEVKMSREEKQCKD